MVGNSEIDNLVDELVQMFGGGQTVPAQQPSTPVASGNLISSPRNYTAPIHGEWKSSGGFTYQPNATHPTGHMGVDMRAPAGTPVYPLAGGVVSNVGTDPKGGNVINVDHGNGIKTYYAHLSTVKVQKGDKVTINTELGTVGNTGNASHTFPHLHFQVWDNGAIQDPAKFFSVPPYTSMSNEEKMRGNWLSEQAKQDAEAFNMKDHLAQRRVAFSNSIDNLLKISFAYYQLTKKL